MNAARLTGRADSLRRESYVENGPMNHFLDPWGDGRYRRLPFG
jgi:hypothetical protein